MFVVGIAQLAGGLDDEAPRLAQNLACTAYEARQLLLPGLPAVVLVTADKDAALTLLGHLRARGHDALAFDGQAIVPSQVMQAPRLLHLEADALVTDAPQPERLPFADIFVLLRATHRTQIESVTEQKTKQLSAGRALLTGGLVTRTTKVNEVTSRIDERHDVLYVYRRSGQTPWLFVEGRLRYEWLGSRMAPTERANFETTIAVLRERAPHARFDDRLVGRKVADRVSQAAAPGLARGRVNATSSDAGMDMVAHLLTMWMAKQARG